MLREILFRAFYKGDIEKNEPLIFTQKEIDNELYFVMEKDEEFRYKFFIPFIDNDWILEQWTGLKDKNGKKIFEGDIVKYNWDNAWCKNNEFHTEIRLVEYSQYGFNPFIEDYTCDDDYYSNRIDFDSIEVIGNKFDNPELLEVQ